MAALFFTSVLAGAAAADKEVPFLGSIQAAETSAVQPPNLVVEGRGFGNATHLGRFTVSYDVEVDLATRASIGSAEFIAANGDTIFAEFIGQGNPLEGTDFSSIVEFYVISFGTGRFADASGTFTVERLLNRVTGATSGSFDGSISY